jgi:hypothetical protein
VACGHQFHLRCVLEWFQSGAAASNTCPYDRVVLYRHPTSSSNTGVDAFNEFLGRSSVPRATRLGDFADLDDDLYTRGFWPSFLPPPSTGTTDSRLYGSRAGTRRVSARNIYSDNHDQDEDTYGNPFALPHSSPSASPPSDLDVDAAFGLPPSRPSVALQGFVPRRNALVTPSLPRESTVARELHAPQQQIQAMHQPGDEGDLPGATSDSQPDNLPLGSTRPETNVYSDLLHPRAFPRHDSASLVPGPQDALLGPRIREHIQMQQAQNLATLAAMHAERARRISLGYAAFDSWYRRT